MDPSNPSAAATTSNSSRDAALASFLDAMRLGDHSPARDHGQGQHHVEMLLLQQHRHAAPSREQQQLPALQMRMDSMMQELQIARQFWPQPAAFHPREEVGSSSRGAAAAINALVGGYVPTQSASPHQSAAGSSAAYTLRASASQFQPAPSATNTSPYHSVAGSSAAYTLHASASQYQPAPSATNTSPQYPMANQAASSAPDYAGSIPERLRAIRAQAPAVRRGRTLEETLSELLGGEMGLHLVTFPDSAAHVVWLLQEEGREDHELIRRSVLAGVTRRVHDFMDDREGHQVLAALLRACAGRYAEVGAIVQAASVVHNPNGRQSLLRLTKHDHWETCLRELTAAAAPFSDLCAMLVDRLLREGVMEHDGGDRVLYHCFDTMRYEDTVILLHDAIDKYGSLLNSKTGAGSRCLVECYANARGDELRAFEKILIDHAHFIARGKYSNYFIQHALQYGDDETRQRLFERLIGDVENLSLDCYGSYVVEACFQKTGQPHLVLEAFLHLDEAQLARLVQGQYSNYVVHKLLDATIEGFPAETMELARRIDSLLPRMRDKRYIRTVMALVRKLFARYGRMYGL